MLRGRHNRSFLSGPERFRSVLWLMFSALLVSGLAVAAPPAQSDQHVIDVRDFGAIGDGISDDRPAIQAAINAAPVGGSVYIPQGIYNLSKTSSAWSLLIQKPLRLYGDGDDSVLKAKPEQGDWNRLITVRNTSQVTIELLTLDGNGKNQSGYRDDSTTRVEQSHVLFLSAVKNALIRNLTLLAGTGDGVYFHGGSSGLVEYNKAFGNNSPNPRVAFNFQGAQDAVFSHNYAQDFGVGFKAECDSTVNTERVQVVNNISRNTSMGIATNGIHDRQIYAKDIYIANNDLEFTDSRGLWLKDTVNITIEKNIFRQRAEAGTAFYLRGHVENATIRDNTFLGADNGMLIYLYPYPGGLISRQILVEENEFPEAAIGVYLVHPGSVDGLQFSRNNLAPRALLVRNPDYGSNLTIDGNTYDGPRPTTTTTNSGTTTPAPSSASSTSTSTSMTLETRTETTLGVTPSSTSTAVGRPATTEPTTPERREVLDVKRFGALGDGLHDDTAALQAAIDEGAAHGLYVFLPQGEYLVSQASPNPWALQLRSGTRLQGEGAKTVIRLAPGQDYWTRILSGSGLNGVEVDNLVIDGAKTDQESSGQQHSLFLATSSNIELSKLAIRDSGGSGIELYGSKSIKITGVDVRRAQTGIAIVQPSGLAAADVTIEDSNLRQNTDGITLAGGERIVIHNNSVGDNKRGVLINADPVSLVRSLSITSNHFMKEVSQSTGIEVIGGYVDDTLITKNVFDGAGMTPLLFGNTPPRGIAFRENALISATQTR